MPAEVLLKVEHVTMTFGTNVVLRDVNAEIVNNDEHGQVVCFLGPSGRGKTQLSRIIAGLQTPTSGQVTLRNGKPTRRGDACMVPQHYPMFDYTTVAGNLRIAGRMAGLNKDQINIRATGFIEEFGLKEHLGKYPRELSGGTKQRVAIARQLMCASNYMVMDEPFSGLDPIMKARAAEAITKLASLDTYNTVIVVTHDVTQGLTVADKVWMLGYDPSTGPGARIVETYDLVEMGFAWQPNLEANPDFLAFVRKVKDRFQTL